MTLAGSVLPLPESHTASEHRSYTAPFRCDNEDCGELSIGQAEFYLARAATSQTEMSNAIQTAHIVWTPSSVNRPKFPDVPDQIAATATEAHACISIQAYRGAVALARAVVEATAKDQGITSGPLVAKIDEMHRQNKIKDLTRELAHEIREGGNEIAHGDLADEPMPPEDAEAVVALMNEILEEVYQQPARMLALRKSRLEREQRNAAKKAGS